jgi:hypothetical protein
LSLVCRSFVGGRRWLSRRTRRIEKLSIRDTE